MAIERDYDDLARIDKTHVSLYNDQGVYSDEMERIFYRSWIYVAHESEIPNPGDYKTTFMGDIPVIVTRGENNEINVVINRCTHRGVAVCPLEKGNTPSFVCQYHGWEFGMDGELLAVSMPRGYNEGELDFKSLGLVSAKKVESYRGIIFASLLSVPDISLDEKLRGVKEYIDMYMDFSPVGEVIVGNSGVNKHYYNANWKIQTEGSVEGYHAPVTHATAFDIMIRKMGMPDNYQGYGTKGMDGGYGNNLLEVYSLPDEAVYKRWPAEYIDLMIEKHGKERAMHVLRHRFNLVIFPNLAILEYQFRVIRPMGTDKTEVRMYHTMLKDAPDDINTRRVREHEFFYSPAAFGGPDDYAMFDRAGQGMKAEMVPWILFNRGIKSEKIDEHGRRYGGHTQETQQRAPYFEYRRLMKVGGQS